MLLQHTKAYLWCVRSVKESEFSEGFVWRCVGAVGDRRAGRFPVVLHVRPVRGASVQPGGLPWRRGAAGEDHAARGPEVRGGSEALLVPQLHLVVPAGLVQGAAASLQALIHRVPSHWHRGIHLREAGLPPGAVVYVLYGLILPIAGGKL